MKLRLVRRLMWLNRLQRHVIRPLFDMSHGNIEAGPNKEKDSHDADCFPQHLRPPLTSIAPTGMAKTRRSLAMCIFTMLDTALAYEAPSAESVKMHLPDSSSNPLPHRAH